MNDGSIRDGTSGPPWYGGHVGPLGSATVQGGLLRTAGGRAPEAWPETPRRVPAPEPPGERSEGDPFTRS